jgi:hypothetical protein
LNTFLEVEPVIRAYWSGLHFERHISTVRSLNKACIIDIYGILYIDTLDLLL